MRDKLKKSRLSGAFRIAFWGILAVTLLGGTAFAKKVQAQENIFTQEELEYVAGMDPLKVGYVPGRIPISFRNGDTGELDGVSRKIFDRIAEISGLKFEYVELPYGSVTYQYLWDQGYDLVTSVEYNEANLHASGILMSQPYLISRKVIVGRSDLRFSRNDNLKIAVAMGSQTLKGVLKEHYPSFDILDYDTIEDCFEAVRKQEADLLIQNQYVAEYLLSKPIYEKLQVIPVEGFDDELCFSAVTPLGEGNEEQWAESKIVIEIINKAIGQMTDEEVANIMIMATMENRYQYQFSDFLYHYRYSIAFISIVFVILITVICVSIRFYLKTTRTRAETKAREHFLSTMSHEIRTPLNGLIGLNYLMMQNLEHQEKMAVYLQQSSSTAKYLLSLVNDILDMSSLHENGISLESKPLSLQFLISTLEALVRSRMEEKGIVFQVDAEISYPGLLGDEDRIEQVLLNILDNAYKFTPRGGRVDMKVSQDKSEDGKVLTSVTVTDTGCGMSESFQKKIFDTFTQERSTVSKGTEGTGLGMSISYRLSKLMGGDLTVKSALGTGSTFVFSFPANVIAEPVAGAPVYGSGEEMNPQRPKHILIAEDNELNAEILSELLMEEGYLVSVAENGFRAVELFEVSEIGGIDIILMDILMPVMNGYEATRAIRESHRPDARRVKIFACTANSYKEDRDKAFESGMDDFITKPVDVERLLNKLKEI